MDALMVREPLDFRWANTKLEIPSSSDQTDITFEEFPDEISLDIYEEDRELVITASLPGFKKDEVDVEMQAGILYIEARHMKGIKTKKKRYYCHERLNGALKRQVLLPTMVVADQARGELKEGVLTLRIPLAEKGKMRQIDINWPQK